MKKIIFILGVITICLSYYFIGFWEPNETVKKSTTVEESNKEVKKSIEKNNKKENEVRVNIDLENKELLNKVFNKLSTTDILRIEEAIKRGDISESDKILKERLLEKDYNEIRNFIKK